MTYEESKSIRPRKAAGADVADAFRQRSQQQLVFALEGDTSPRDVGTRLGELEVAVERVQSDIEEIRTDIRVIGSLTAEVAAIRRRVSCLLSAVIVSLALSALGVVALLALHSFNSD